MEHVVEEKSPLTLHGHSVWSELAADEPWSSLISTARPSRRYGHAAAYWDEHQLMIITHGYYYDLDTQRAEWLSDTWAFDSHNQWTMIHGACDNGALCPNARFGTTSVIHQSSLYLAQGDDGGHDKRSTDPLHAVSYQYSLLTDVWMLPLTWPLDHSSTRWILLTSATSRSHLSTVIQGSKLVTGPAARAHHAAVISNLQSSTDHTSQAMMLSFGGMVYDETKNTTDQLAVAASNELWRFGMKDHLWTQVKCSLSPPVRFGHAMTSINPTADSVRLFVYGGFQHDKPDHADLWSVVLNSRVDDCVWVELLSGQPATVAPIGRGYPSLVASSHRTHLLMFGGAHCVTGCQCKDETWSFDLSKNEWSLLHHSSQSRPSSRYKHTAVSRKVSGSSITHMLVFGGESYVPQRYHSDVWELWFDPTHVIGPASAIPAEYLDLIVLLGVLIGLLIFVLLGRKFKHKVKLKL
jgi:hypothetical protein